MVTFKLVEENEKQIIYWYFPEGDETKRQGVIVVDKVSASISVTELAEKDFERDIPPEEINILIDAINKMRIESGQEDLLERTTKAEHSIFYGDHAVSEIIKHLNKDEVPKKGMQMWY